MSDEQNTTSKWPVGSTVNIGTFYGRPIEWTVIRADGNYRLLLTTNYISERRIGKSSTKYWKDSELYQWLNGEFLDTAFTTSERKQLCAWNDSYVTLLSSEELLEFRSLPACVYERHFRWWLRDINAYSDVDSGTYYECSCLYGNCLDRQPPNKSLFVRPTIAVSLDGEKHSIPTFTFNDYYHCPFCGTEHRYGRKSCSCCGFSRARYRWTKATEADKQRNTKLDGCSISILLFFSFFIFIGIWLSEFLAFLFGFLPLCFILYVWIKDRTEPPEEEKYTSDKPPLIVYESKDYQERRAAIYHNARILHQNARTSSDYSHVANMYSLISGYRDADDQREICLKNQARAEAKKMW